MSDSFDLSFVGLTEELCQEAFDLIRPSLGVAMDNGPFNRSQGHLVVVNPSIPWEPKYKSWDSVDGAHFFEAILFEADLGDPGEWEFRFADVARAKAFASWKTGLTTHEIQQIAPYLYQEGWTKHGGSAVAPGGFVVAFSGVQGYFDRMIAEWMISACRAVCMHRMHDKTDGVMSAADIDFLGRRN